MKDVKGSTTRIDVTEWKIPVMLSFSSLPHESKSNLLRADEKDVIKDEMQLVRAG